ncbi:FHA domain-containing protein [Chloroflexales bacterium ZM16-3]|nr:FHA domain-containing protein [Chloroflexales bacterium ZM16-3]
MAVQRLRVTVSDGRAPQEFDAAALRAGVVIGRGDGAVIPDVLIDDGKAHVSRQHAELRLVGDEVQLVHRSSSQPTVLNGQPLTQGSPAVTLRDGDKISITSFQLQIQILRAPPPPAPAPAPPPAPAPKQVPAQATGGTIRLSAPSTQAAAGDAQRRPIIWPVAQPGPSQYLALLPIIFQVGERSDAPGFLARYLKIFEEIWEPLEQRQDYIDAWFHPATCPEPFLDLLARWLGIEFLPGTPLERRRGILVHAPTLHEQRGTQAGLLLAIKAYTGLQNEVKIDQTGNPHTFRVQVPRSSGVSEDWLAAIIELYKPAHVGYYLELF